MANNEVVMENVNTAVTEAAKKVDHTGAIFVGLGFLAGAALTVGTIQGAKKLKKVRAEKKSKKAAPIAVVSEK